MSVKFLNGVDVLVPKKQIIGRIGMIAHMADVCGYEYFIWKEIVYHKENGIWVRTPYTKLNIQ